MIPGPYESLRKALQILELLAARSPRGVSEIASELRLEKSSVSRLLKALSSWGYVVQNLERGQYQMGPRVLVLAEQYLHSDVLLREAQPVLRDLALAARASAHLGVVVGDQMLLVAKEASPEAIQVASRVGGRVSPHASALGRILLAGLPEKEQAAFLSQPMSRYTDRTVVERRRLLRMIKDVRRRGFAFESGEEHPGVGCIGVPVKGRAGRWIAAISVSGPLQGTPFRLDRRHRELALRAGEAISRRLALPAATSSP